MKSCVKMSRIRKHMFATEEKTPIYVGHRFQKVKAYLPKGSWMGVLETHRDGCKIISSRVDGWIQNCCCKKLPTYQRGFHIQYHDSGIQYLVS